MSVRAQCVMSAEKNKLACIVSAVTSAFTALRIRSCAKFAESPFTDPRISKFTCLFTPGRNRTSTKHLLNRPISNVTPDFTPVTPSIHSGTKPHDCDYCYYQTARKPSLNTHLKIYHFEHMEKCPVCCDYFYSKESLKSHKCKKKYIQ
ncbi:hypothetical protein CDAR_367381 [Caerostris darwini]|uniref:C2H2-type domain-containing protein n=1 Tax=Caerostris darwini TaxID=1538125 RepID=A0AAV4PBS8_9ARAC|nr:hypothetical protein CDAR_367381 [Caerostris darwini]